jgi:hypothetical protein
MKTTNLIKIALVILLGIAIQGQVRADKEKFSRFVIPVHVDLAHKVMLPSTEIRNQPLEDWMFEPEYLCEETGAAVEPWMLETNYLNEEVHPLESWMFSESHLSEEPSKNAIESWMLDATYLCK